jgi:hypothetical protein
MGELMVHLKALTINNFGSKTASTVAAKVMGKQWQLVTHHSL